MAITPLAPGAGSFPGGSLWLPEQQWRRTGYYCNSGVIAVGIGTARIVGHDENRLAVAIRAGVAAFSLRWPERMPTIGSVLIDMAAASTVILTVFTHGPMVTDEIIASSAGAGSTITFVEWLAKPPVPERSLNANLRRLAESCGIGRFLNGR